MKKFAIILAFNVMAIGLPKLTGASAGDEDVNRIPVNDRDDNVLEVTNINQLELNKENLLAVIKYFQIKQPEIVFKQAVLESAHFGSWLCYTHNNLFGMYQPSRRKTASMGKQEHGYATFSHWTKSVEDYKLWQDTGKTPTDDYYAYLEERGYCENEAYTNILKGVRLPKEINFKIVPNLDWAVN